MKNFSITIIVLAAIGALSWAIIDKEIHEWHPIGPNVKFGTLLEVKGEGDEPLLASTDAHGEPKPYEKTRTIWDSNKINEDSLLLEWTTIDSEIVITATTIDFGPDSNAWVRFDWCSRHGEVRAVRVE